MIQILTQSKEQLIKKRKDALNKLESKYNNHINSLLNQKSFIMQTIIGQYDVMIQKVDSIIHSTTINTLKDTKKQSINKHHLISVHDVSSNSIKIKSQSERINNKNHHAYILKKKCQSERINNSDATFQCNKCDKYFLSNRDLSTHSKMHDFCLQFPCKVCGRRFETKQYLNRHIKVHPKPKNSNKNKKNQITQRKQINNNENNKKKEINEPLPLKSDSEDSDYDPLDKDNLNIHAPDKLKHKKIKKNGKFICSVCSASLQTAGGLTIHYRSHTGERPFKCPYCNDGFTSQSALTYHSNKIHDKEPFLCDVCKQDFRQKKRLKTHIISEHGNALQKNEQ